MSKNKSDSWAQDKPEAKAKGPTSSRTPHEVMTNTNFNKGPKHLCNKDWYFMDLNEYKIDSSQSKDKGFAYNYPLNAA